MGGVVLIYKHDVIVLNIFHKVCVLVKGCQNYEEVNLYSIHGGGVLIVKMEVYGLLIQVHYSTVLALHFTPRSHSTKDTVPYINMEDIRFGVRYSDCPLSNTLWMKSFLCSPVTQFPSGYYLPALQVLFHLPSTLH